MRIAMRQFSVYWIEMYKMLGTFSLRPSHLKPTWMKASSK
jgi:hypothetical protein